MSELASLHRRLRRAIVWAALLPACTSTSEPKQPEPTPTPEPSPTPTPEPTPIDEVAPTTAIVTPPDEVASTTAIAPPDPFPRPTCPNGEWCGTEALAKPLAHDDPGVAKRELGACPGMITAKIGVDTTTSDYAGLMLGGNPATLDVAASEAKRAAGQADACCYDWFEHCPGGRPLLVAGRPVVADLQPGSSWSAELPSLTHLPTPALRERVADAWRRDGLTEHASITSFMRARAELLAIGAPHELLDGCERAAVDEVEHARLCLGLAAAISGAALEPGPLALPDPRGGGPIRVALDTFAEGCVSETIAAAGVRRAARLARDPVVRALLDRIADDEAEHAALAWSTLAWLLATRGPAERAAMLFRLLDLARALRPTELREDDREPERDAWLEQGRLDARVWARVEAETWSTLIDPLLADLCDSPQSTAPHCRATSSTPRHISS